jgi:hypothetical protein
MNSLDMIAYSFGSNPVDTMILNGTIENLKVID